MAEPRGPAPVSDAKRSVLATLADRSYLDTAKQLFASAYDKGGWKGDYLLLAHGLSEAETEWFRERRILVHHCEPLFSGTVGGHPAVLTSKLHLFTAAFRRWRTVVYCDADASVRGSLDGLDSVRGFWSVDDVSGWLDVQILPWWLRRRRGVSASLYRTLTSELRGRDLMARPFCAGFFAFDTDLIEADTFSGLARTIDRYHPISRYGDQLAFNLFFGERWQTLPPVYNIQVRAGRNRWRLPPSDLEGLVIHHISPAKPWTTRGAFYEEWRTNLDLAERMDLGRTPDGTKWSSDRIREYSTFLDSLDYVERVRRLTHRAERVGGRVPARVVRLVALTAAKALPLSPARRRSVPVLETVSEATPVALEPHSPTVGSQYLLCTTPRSGSTLLCLLLSRTGVAGMRPVPIFGWESLLDLNIGPGVQPQGLDLEEYLRMAMRRTATPNGTAGFKVMWGQVAELGRRMRRSARYRGWAPHDLPRLLPSGTRYVWLVRRNRLRQAVSLSRAMQTQCWDSQAQREFEGLELFDHRHIRSLLAMLETQAREWEALFERNGIDPLKMTYEDVVADPEEAVRAVLDHLGVAPPERLGGIPQGFDRQADAVTDNWVRRFERIEASGAAARRWHAAAGYPRRLAGGALGAVRARRWLRAQVGTSRWRVLGHTRAFAARSGARSRA